MEENYTNITDYLLDNIETLKDIVGEINSWDGSLDYLEYFENNEDFFNTYFYQKPMEVARAIYYGDYHYMDDYVHFNAYGNLDSCSEWEYEDELKSYIDEIVDRIKEEKENLDLEDNIIELLEREEA